MKSRLVLSIAVLAVFATVSDSNAQVLDKQLQLRSQTFWDNRDWNWFAEHIPFFECPDEDITTTYYYRWELLTKHLTYGSPNSGYSFTEFIDRPFWSGAYGAISCPAGHQLYEARWLRNPQIARDYSRYWFRTPGAQPRNYSTWLADAVWAVGQVHSEDRFLTDLLPDLVKNYEGWEQRHYIPEIGLFWQTGHDDGMEFNINSRQTQDILRGAPSYRPSFNAYMWADAIAISKIARLADKDEIAQLYKQKADQLKNKMQELLWDEHRQFFFPVFKNDEERDGHKIKALSKTYETGQFAGNVHGRELIGYVPWQFHMLDANKGYEAAWKKLMDRDAFYADFGPTTVERHDPMFLLQKSCCWWSGQSWPYATTQTLKAMANLLQSGRASDVTSSDYVKLLQIYARSHRKEGRPYLAEALNPDTGSFEGHDGYNHSEHYFHSGYSDLVITGLVGLTPIDSARFELQPLAPSSWDWFALDDVVYHGRRISVVWDRLGSRYSKGKGLMVLVDGEKLSSSAGLERLTVTLPPLSRPEPALKPETTVNFAVNNDGTYYPRLTASYTAPNTSISKLNDGNYWYIPHPPNRWTCVGSPNATDSVVIDFGTKRSIHTIKIYPLDDEGNRDSTVRTPNRIELEAWFDNAWHPLKEPTGVLDKPVGHRANVIQYPLNLKRYRFGDALLPPIDTTKLRVTLHHPDNGKSGLTEIEAWGDVVLPLVPEPPPSGNLAYNPGPKNGGSEFPKANASHTSRFDRVETANDGITNFLPTPANRWTSYESPSATDWLEIDFGKAVEFRRVELAIYDDQGGVQAPTSYQIQFWDGHVWKDVGHQKSVPEKPVGGQWNEVRFDPAMSFKIRVVMTHRGQSRSGVSEILVWND
jgi:hypothetical protein